MEVSTFDELARRATLPAPLPVVTDGQPLAPVEGSSGSEHDGTIKVEHADAPEPPTVNSAVVDEASARSPVALERVSTAEFHSAATSPVEAAVPAHQLDVEDQADEDSDSDSDEKEKVIEEGMAEAVTENSTEVAAPTGEPVGNQSDDPPPPRPDSPSEAQISRPASPASLVQHYARCDGCAVRWAIPSSINRPSLLYLQMDPIMGSRYRCLDSDCPDYDLCEKCMNAGIHPKEHRMLLIKTPDEREHLSNPVCIHGYTLRALGFD